MADPRVGPQVDWVRVRRWLRSYEETHGHENTYASPQVFHGPQRVIDFKGCCLVRTPTDCRYVALSYVWGKPVVEKSRALKAKVGSFEREGSLSYKRVSLTILDAMGQCAQLEERWL